MARVRRRRCGPRAAPAARRRRALGDRAYPATHPAQPNDFVTVIVPEADPRVARRLPAPASEAWSGSRPGCCGSRTSWSPTCRSWSDAVRSGRTRRALIPQRTVTLVFVSSVNDATIRAVNYARSLGAAETRAIYFDLDPDEAHDSRSSGSTRGWASRSTSSRRRSATSPGRCWMRSGGSPPAPDTVVQRGDPGVRGGQVAAPPPAQPERAVHQAALPVRGARRALERAVHRARTRARATPPPSRREVVTMDRWPAVAFCREKCLKETTVRHLISVEGVMRRARRPVRRGPGPLGADRALPRPGPGSHGRRRRSATRELAASWLREEGVDERIVNGVLAHAYEAVSDRPDVEGGRARRRGRGAAGRLRARPAREGDGHEGLVGEEEAQGEGVRSRREPRGDHGRRVVDRAAAGRVPRGVDRGAAVGRRRDRACRDAQAAEEEDT